MASYFQFSEVLGLTWLNVPYAIIAVLLVAGGVWMVSSHNSPAHKLADSVFICAAAAAVIAVVVKVVEARL